jgi:hypothetical protein
MSETRQYVKVSLANTTGKKNAPDFEGKKSGAKILKSNTSLNERG